MSGSSVHAQMTTAHVSISPIPVDYGLSNDTMQSDNHLPEWTPASLSESIFY
jgi:hypothetical protein